MLLNVMLLGGARPQPRGFLPALMVGLVVASGCSLVGPKGARTAPAAPAVQSPSSAPSSMVPSRIDTGDSVDVDFLFNYYDQDGELSPVTGGLGTEDQQVLAPVIKVRWRKSETWTLDTRLGIDQITSASTDNIDDEVSSASRLDIRAHALVGATRTLKSGSFGLDAGFSKEYDYRSVSAGLSFSRDFRERNTSLAASVRHYTDDVDIYPIGGTPDDGDDLLGVEGRDTTDISVGLTQILGPRTLAAVEVSHSMQSGFLSTSFHEVILAPSADFPSGERVAERLPDKRDRSALGLRLNHSISKRFVLRTYYRFYDDDWGVSAHTFEIEPHFRLGTKRDLWVYPILRFHTQDGSSYFGAPGTFTRSDPFYTADGDIGTFDSQKFGFGWRVALGGGGWLGPVRRFEGRATFYDRDDGLEGFSISYGLGWSF